MTKRFRFVFVTGVAILSACGGNRAEAFRFRRSCCAPCQPCFGSDDWECLKTKVYQIAPDDFLYYSDHYANGCNNPPESDAWEDADYNVPQNCPSCIPYSFASQRAHSGLNKWTGLGAPVNSNYRPPLSSCATVLGCHFECLKICAANNTYKTFKVKVFDICISNASRPIHVAYEVDGFPSGCNPCCICLGPGNCKCCPTGHSYSLRYCCKRVLLLTAT